ncbi:helix-turn-helix transcriptional regulator [Bradyrhizobium sediminis]|uniref:Helix-turn-helix transcriptional regulator n=1 Tax=Bradyrhizobium sediminis TaxID=2840469 RepID=A0A975NHW5_9BRAD|nr:helix-turn-helix transcriptional regulator [Bradyrhizobium sediminis]QWG14754.1 helix-turn-helix transcriptional regulator [Bradyrhizobium sediminis]
MDDRKQLSALIGDIYDAVFDPDLRTDVLDRIAGFTGGHSGSLLSKHALNDSENLYCYIGNDPETLQAYSESYPKLDSTADPMSAGIDQIVSAEDLVPYDEFRRGRFYREWARPHGWGDIASAVIDKSATSCTFLSVARQETSGLVDDQMRHRMALVIPHVRRALLIGKTIHHKEAEAICFTDIFDGLSAGMVLVDASGRIVHANSAGGALLEATDFLRKTACGQLVAGDAATNAALRDILVAASAGDTVLGVKGTALPLTAHNGERYIAHVLPLTSGARRGASLAYNAVAALFVRKAALESSPAEVIGEMYKLTPTELRVLLAIVDIGGVPEVAASFGVAATTVKTHLSRLFEKTGVGRQADLVKLVAGFSTPLAN